MRNRVAMIAPAVAVAMLATACGGSEEDTATGQDGDAQAGACSVVREDGESAEDYVQRLYEAAQDEGTATYYTPAKSEEQEAVALYWKETFPEVPLQITPGSTDQILQRALTEGMSGNTKADAMQVSVAEMTALDDAGLLVNYRPANEEFIDQDLVDPEAPWSVAYYLSFHTAYNKNNVDPSELPTDFMGFTEPRWKGKVAVDLNAVEWVAGILKHFGEEKGTEFLRGLAANDVNLVQGTTNRTEQLAAGQFDVMLDGYGHSLKRFLLEGAPIAVPDPQPEPVSQVLAGTVVFEDAPNPCAGRLLSEFFLMEEGQQVYVDLEKAGARVSDSIAHPYEELFGGVDPQPLGADVDFEHAQQVLEDVLVRGG
jgi:iron(III) transport system substrate-binding protein